LAYELLQTVNYKQIAVDGKALRGARKNITDERNMLYLLNALDTESSIVVGQQTIGEKTNEIHAIPELLDTLNIKDTLITIDAMGCQKKIASKIVEQGGDYLLALKENQGNLFYDVKDFFANKIPEQYKVDFHETIDKGHGRVEVRKFWSADDIDWLKLNNKDWAKLISISMVESQRYIHGKKDSIEKRYFISSLKADAKTQLAASRAHWSIENKLHWSLDVVFKEDSSLIRTENAAENMDTVRKIALNLTLSYKTTTSSKNSVPE
jgi:predicted transposase YbfD/YdcC